MSLGRNPSRTGESNKLSLLQDLMQIRIRKKIEEATKCWVVSLNCVKMILWGNHYVRS